MGATSAPKTAEHKAAIAEGMRQAYAERFPQIIECPVCGKDSWYVAREDILTHMDGSSNRKCWAVIDRDELEVS
jgi:hypothetical protein